MKGVYLSEEGKKAIEDELTELRSQWNKNQQTWGRIFTLQDILASATILPVEKSWGRIIFNGEDEVEAENNYPKGVIIQPKPTTDAEV